MVQDTGSADCVVWARASSRWPEKHEGYVLTVGHRDDLPTTVVCFDSRNELADTVYDILRLARTAASAGVDISPNASIFCDAHLKGVCTSVRDFDI